MERGLLMLSQRLRPMLVFCTEDMDTVVLAMLDMAMLVLVTMARGLLMLNQRLMLVCTMEDMDMVLVLDMAVGSTMVKQLIYASKSSKVIFLLFSALYWG